jgi:DNA-binding CsgD family transcriptional regulator
MALVLPIAGDARDVFHAISTIIVFIDPTRRQDASDVVIGLLNEAAGLTGRELDVVRLVGMGRSPQDAADDLGIGYGTLRNHLKGGFAKLGVHTQGELVALIQRLR